jgi:glucan-binding YG repeat protein
MSNYYMYMIDGNLVTGWEEHNGKTYYFSPKALAAVNGVQKIGTFYYVFEDYVLVEGAIVEIDGVQKIAWGGRFLTDTWHTQGGKTYYLLSDGACAVGTVEIPTVNENGETVTETYIFGEDGALIGKA